MPDCDELKVFEDDDKTAWIERGQMISDNTQTTRENIPQPKELYVQERNIKDELSVEGQVQDVQEASTAQQYIVA